MGCRDLTAFATSRFTNRLSRLFCFFSSALVIATPAERATSVDTPATVPAILGALRFSKRFILVGDEQQLPPLVLSKEAAEQGRGPKQLAVIRVSLGDPLGCHGGHAVALHRRIANKLDR